MEAIPAALESILQQHFSVVPARTNRHDQWYKRSYQSWKSEHGDQEPVILTPKSSRDEWTRELNTVAMNFVTIIEHDAEKIHRNQDFTRWKSRNKVFEDHVLDVPLGFLDHYYAHSSPLRPAMQKISYWTDSSMQTLEERRTYHRAVKALLVCEQMETLFHLSQFARSRVRATATVDATLPYPTRRVNVGWQSLIDEILEMLMALIIMRCFPDSLPLEVALEQWVPFVFTRSAAVYNDSTTAKRIKRVLDDHGSTNLTGDGAQIALMQCCRILSLIQALTYASDLPAIDWKRRFADAFLNFVGFECWNREREGQGYLGCDLNIKKDASWLQKAAGPKVVPSTDAVVAGTKKSKDPLFLLEPRVDTELEEEEDNDNSKDLGTLEAQEEAYGLKRSTKYRNKVRHI